MSNEIRYEIISKSDTMTPFLVNEMIIEHNRTVAVTAIGNIDFTNDGAGNYFNENYVIRQVGTQLTPNDDGVVTDAGVEVAVPHDVAVDIINGEVNPDTIVEVSEVVPTVEVAPEVTAPVENVQTSEPVV